MSTTAPIIITSVKLSPEYAAVTPDTADTIDKFIATYGHPSAEDDALLERLILNPTPDYGAVLADEDARGEDAASVTPDATAAGIENFLGTHGVAEAVRPKATAEASQPSSIGANDARLAVYDGSNAAVSAEASAAPSAEAEVAVTPAAVPVTEDAMPAATPAKNSGKDQTPSSSLSESLAKIYIRQGRYRRAYEILSDLNLKNPEKSIYFADQLRFLRKVISLLPPEQEGDGVAR